MCMRPIHLEDVLRNVQADSHNRRNNRRVDLSPFIMTDAEQSPQSVHVMTLTGWLTACSVTTEGST